MATFRQMRKEMGLSQRELSALLGIGRSLLSMHEMGRRLLPVEALSRFMALYRKVQARPGLQENLPSYYAQLKSTEILRLKSEAEMQLSQLQLRLSKLLREREELENTITVHSTGPNDSPELPVTTFDQEYKRSQLQEKLALLCIEVEVTLPVEIEKAKKAVEVLGGML